MLIDLQGGPDQGPQRSETLIIGSGAVGLTMAVELAHAGRHVLVVEAGGRAVDAQSQSFFKEAQCRGHQLRGLHLGRFRALGGTTNFWGGTLLPFDPLVFERRPWVSDAAWPITRQELDPYYERGYQLLGLGRHFSDATVWRRLQVIPPVFGDGLEFFFGARPPEPNLAVLFGPEIETLRNLQVLVNAPVVALELHQTGERVSGVVVRTADGARRRISARRVILANGTIEIARLLRMPLADGRPPPWLGNPWLGNGFVDHVECVGGLVALLDRRRFHHLFDNALFDGVKYMPMMRISSQAQREQKLFDVAAQVVIDSWKQEHIDNAKRFARSVLREHFQGRPLPSPRELYSVSRVAFPMLLRYLRYHRMYNTDQGIQLRLITEQSPLPESSIHLTDNCDRLGMPTVELDWRIDGREIESIASIGEHVAQYLERSHLATVKLDPALVARDPNFLMRGEDTYHHMGMARMANTPADGVVDRNLKVFGTSNLYVAGAATYPTTGSANPTFTAIALGLRLADAISADRLTD